MSMETRARRGGWWGHANIAAYVNRFGDELREYAKNHDVSTAYIFAEGAAGVNLDGLAYPMKSLVADIHREVRRVVEETQPRPGDWAEMVEELDEILEGPGSEIVDVPDLDASLLENLYSWGDWWDVAFDSQAIRSVGEE